MAEKFNDEFTVDTNIDCTDGGSIEEFYDAVINLFDINSDLLFHVDVDYGFSQIHVYGKMTGAALSQLCYFVDRYGFEADNLEVSHYDYAYGDEDDEDEIA